MKEMKPFWKKLKKYTEKTNIEQKFLRSWSVYLCKTFLSCLRNRLNAFDIGVIEEEAEKVWVTWRESKTEI